MALGRSLGVPVLAEGIETEAQWEFLEQAGCSEGQGFLFARPVALSQLPAAIQTAARFRRLAPAASPIASPTGAVAAA
jgi:EAL domain-containing protein (putative c-di-GMP-specific phosphodiesterase class I)